MIEIKVLERVCLWRKALVESDTFHPDRSPRAKKCYECDGYNYLCESYIPISFDEHSTKDLNIDYHIV